MIVSPEASASHRKVDFRERYPDTVDENPPSNQRKLDRIIDRARFVTVGDQVAEHTHYERNYKYPGADQLFPNWLDADQRIVTKCYPLAKKGMLLVSEPRHEAEVKKAWEKHKILRKLGFRHIVVEPDTTLYDALAQLGEI